MRSADFLQMPDSKRLAVSRITSNLQAFDAEQLLCLACQYNVPAFIEPAMMRLIATPYGEIALDTAHTIGIRPLFHLNNTRLRLLKWRIDIAVDVPFYYHVDCSNVAACRKAWKNVWHSRLTALLVHTDDPLPPSSAINLIEMISSVPGMCQLCLTDTKVYIVQENPWTREREIVEEAIKQMEALVGNDV